MDGDRMELMPLSSVTNQETNKQSHCRLTVHISRHSNVSGVRLLSANFKLAKTPILRLCIQTSQLMLYREIIAVCSQIHTKHINTLCGQNVEFVNVKCSVRTAQ